MEANLQRSCELEMSEDLEKALEYYEGPIVIHKNNGQAHLYAITNPGGLDLFRALHQGHDDIIDEIIQYGEYLLNEKLRKEKPAVTLALIKK